MATKRKPTHGQDASQALERRARIAEREWLALHPNLEDSLAAPAAPESRHEEDPERKRQRDRQRERTRVRTRPPRGWKRVPDKRFKLGVRELVTAGHPAAGETEPLTLRGQKGLFQTERPISGRRVILEASDDSDLHTGCRIAIRRPKGPGGVTTIRVYRPERDLDGVPITLNGRKVELPPLRTKQSFGLKLDAASQPVAIDREVLPGVTAIVVADMSRVAELDFAGASNHPEWAQLLGTAMTWALQRRAGGVARNGEEAEAGSSGHSIRKWLLRNCDDVPTELTPRMLDGALSAATLSRGGGRPRRNSKASGKRSLANVLADLVKQIEATRSKPN